MKQLKYILLFLSMITGCGVAMAQTPVSPVQLTTNTPYLEPSTGLHWYYNGINYLWYKSLGVKDSTYYVTPNRFNTTTGTSTQNQITARELLSNKATTFGTLNNTLYPTTQAVANYVSASSPVLSVFGRTGAVTAQTGDYSAFYPILLGSYTNPPWITSLAWSKITGAPTSFPTPNPVTFNNSGSGAASGTTFDGSVARTISYNTIGAQPALGYTPENVANKATSFGVLNNTLYPTTQAVANYTSGKVDSNKINYRSSRPAYLEQFIGGFFGRGMLTAETINITTEQFITASAVVGDDEIAVTSNTNFLVGGTVTIKHDNGLYGTYFITAKSGSTNIGILPYLRYPVSAGIAKIERLWFNRPHPGKYYMRELAQKIAYSTELDASMPVNRMLFTNFSASVPTAIDTLVAVNGATINYYPASNDGVSSAAPVRFPIGTTAAIDYDAEGEGAETRLINLENSNQVIASVALSAASATVDVVIHVINEYDNIIAADTVRQNTTAGIFQIYKVPFLTANSKQVKVRVTVDNSSSGSIYVGQIDVYESPVSAQKIIAKSNPIIVGYGDSWMAGDTASSPERESILTQLAIELPNATIINKGVGGNTVVDLNNRFETDVAPYHPDYVILECGTNDAYNPASATFDPNAIDAFTRIYNILIGKVLAIGARPIIIGVPALAQTDAESPSLGEWELNDRARLYQRYFYERLAITPPGIANTVINIGNLTGDVTSVNRATTIATINGITKNYYDPTSSIQTQLNSKGPGTVTLVSSTTSDITIANGTTTPTLTFNNINGITKTYYDPTSSIQTQLNAKQSTIPFGTGVQTALGVNIGSAGAPVLFDGAGGTPSSITLTNASGTAASLNIGGNAATATTIKDLSALYTAINTGNIFNVTASGFTSAAGVIGISGGNGFIFQGTAGGAAYKTSIAPYGGDIYIGSGTGVLRVDGGLVSIASGILPSGSDGQIIGYYDGGVPVAIGRLNVANAWNFYSPTTGTTVNLTNNGVTIIDPATSLAALTINLPSSPSDGDRVKYTITQAVTTVSYSGGTIVANPTAFTGRTEISHVFRSATSTWY